MSVKSTLDLKALKANRNIAARNYWRNRVTDSTVKPYFGKHLYLRPVEGNKYSTRTVYAPPETGQFLHTIAASDKTKFIVLLSALAVLAHKYASVDDVILFCPVFLKNQETDTEEGIIPVRLQNFAAMTFRQMLLLVKDHLLQDLKHSDYPVEKILAAEQQELKKLATTGMLMSEIQEPSSFDGFFPGILFSFIVGNGLSLTVTCDECKEEEEYINRLPELYFGLLHTLLTNPEKTISDVEIISPGEKHTLLFEFNDTVIEFPGNAPLMRLWEEQVEKNPGKNAVLWNSRVIDFYRLNANANKLARYLEDKGVQPGQTVALLLDKTIGYVTGMIAILKAGAIIVPVDPGYADDVISYLVKDSNASCIICCEDTLVKRDIKMLCSQVFIDRHQPAIDKYSAANTGIHDNDVTYIQYTYRAGEEARGVAGNKTAFLNLLQWGWKNFPYNKNEVGCQKAGLRVSDHITEVLSPLLKGTPVVLINEEETADAEKMARLIMDRKISRITVTPSFLRGFLAIIKEKRYEMPFLRFVFCTREQLSFSLAREFYTVLKTASLINLYGNAEAGTVTCFNTGDLFNSNQNSVLEKNGTVPVGKPIANRKISILDMNRNPVPIGVAGEIWTEDGLQALQTGDIGRWLFDGSIELLGNMADEVTIVNCTVQLKVVEDIIATHPEIKEAVAVVGEDGENKYLAVYYVSDTIVKPVELQAYLLSRLPFSRVQMYFVKLVNFQRTPFGKAGRTALPDPVIGMDEKYVAPSNEWEEKMTGIWADLLKLDRKDISVNASFFRLGGHSLRAMTLVNKIHGLFGIDISIKEVFKRKSIQNLVKLLQSSGKSEYSQFKKAEEKEYYDLSISQMRLYYLQELDHSSLSLNIPAVLKIEGDLDNEKLQQAFYRLVVRQESLRTYFKIINERPVQLVMEVFDFEIEYFQAPESEVDAIAKRFIRPFNLGKPPLFRVGLIETAPQVFYLMVDIHHIVTDGTSMGLLVNDFMAFYADEPLPALDLHYKDYATWQQSTGYKKKSDRQKNFWVNQFAEPIVPLSLPIDFIRPSGSSSEGDVINFDLDIATTLQLRAIAQTEIVTTSMLLLAMLNVVLGKMAAQEDIVIGMAVAGREEFALENMIGMFPVVLPLRNHSKGNLKFNEFLNVLRTNFLSALDNQGYHYEELAKELDMERNTDRNPWFDVLFLYQNFERPDLVMPGLQISLYKDKNIVAHEKLNISVTENEKQVFFRLVYSKLLFKKQTIERLIKYFKHVINTVIKDTSIRIADIELVSAREKIQMARIFNKPKIAINMQETFTDLFRKQVQKTPAKIAVEHNGSMLTYSVLDATCRRLAACLIAAGIRNNKNVTLYMPRGIGMLVSIIASFYAGASYVPVDIAFPAERVKEILDDSESEVIITTKEMMLMVNEWKNSLPALKEIICLEEQDETAPSPDVLVTRNADDLAYIIYTSGTTGKPKGVMIHQLGMVNHIYAMIEVLGLNESDVIAQTASPSFDISVWQFLTALTVGGKTLIIDNEKVVDPHSLIGELQQKKVTIFQSVPSLITTFLDELVQEDDRDLPNLRWMIPTGEPLTVALTRKWYNSYPSIPLLNAYGPAEASDDVTTHLVKMPAEGQLAIPVGKPVRNMHIYILDSFLKLCPVGVKGEICVAGPGVGKGYWKDEEKTKKAFIPNPFMKKTLPAAYATLYKTGDLGYYLEDGNVVCLGRKDDQVKIRGFRIELGEIESRLLRHEAIREVVILVKEWAGDKHLVAYYVSEEKIKPADLENYLSGNLPYYMIPSSFIHLTELPVTINGKLDKRALPDPEIKSKEAYVAPTTQTEEKLVDIWSNVLKTGDNLISVETSFFYIGGHSLNAITIINKIFKEFNVKISLKEFFMKPTVRSTSEFIDAHLWLKKEVTAEEENQTEVIL